MPAKQKATLLTAQVYNPQGEVVESVELPQDFFDQKVNSALLAQATKVYQANKHLGTVKTKTRGEVAGSTAKLYRQKGTGRARAGSKRAPQRVGGGLAFGPRPRSMQQSLPKKMRKAALVSALTSKWQERRITFVTGFEALEPKTKRFCNALGKLPLRQRPTLFVLPRKVDSVVRGMRNLEEVRLLPASILNSYDVLSAGSLIITKDALQTLAETWGKNKGGDSHAA